MKKKKKKKTTTTTMMMMMMTLAVRALCRNATAQNSIVRLSLRDSLVVKQSKVLPIYGWLRG